ncbi:MAG: TIR domain-containing protein [Telluria sp.]
MAIRHGCFFSYAHGRHALMNRFKNDLAEAIRCYLEPHFDTEDELFIDTDGLGGGDDLERRLARALCESVSMVVIYTPKYEAHEATRREFAAMQQLEHQRSQWYRLPSRLIIPVIMTRHPLDLPPQIKQPGFYLDFSGYTMATGDLKSNPEFLPHIEKLVERIATQYHYQKIFTPADHDCNQFTLPPVTAPWRDTPDFSFPKI